MDRGRRGAKIRRSLSHSARLPLIPHRGSLKRMTTHQLIAEALALPISERVSLAQALWRSIDSGLADAAPNDSLREAIGRDHELSSGAVAGRTHEEVMAVARSTL
jgi:hypothetical protein